MGSGEHKSRSGTAGMAPFQQENVMLGIGLKVSSVAIFLAMATFLKAANGVPVGEMVFFRSFFAIFPILVFLIARRQLVVGMKTQRPFAHLLRGMVGVTAMSFIFLALTKLPLPEATALNYTTPLLIVVLGALILKETVRLYRWSAVLVGLAGVLVIIWPRLTLFSPGADFGGDLFIGAVAALIGATVAAVASLTVRNLVRTERSATIVLYFSITSSALALITLPFGWVWPNPLDLALLIGAGFAGGIAQILLTESYRNADMSIIAPFEYTSLVLSVIVGYFVFAEVPTLNTLAGGALVVAAGIFIILRERRLGLERAKARKVTTPQG